MQIQRIREYQDSENPYLQEYLDARSAFDQAKRHLEETQRKLISKMQEDSVKTFTVSSTEGVRRTVTYVASRRVVIDEKGLRRALTAKVFDRYTKKVLDKPALEKAMGDGEIDPMVVARFVSEKEAEPYLRYTEKEDTNE